MEGFKAEVFCFPGLVDADFFILLSYLRSCGPVSGASTTTTFSYDGSSSIDSYTSFVVLSLTMFRTIYPMS